MIASLRGTLLEKQPTRLVVEVGGVGFEVLVPLSTSMGVGEPGETVSLRTVLHVREDALVLYGFLSDEARQLFLRLISVSGIGPKIALNALSGPSPADLVGAIQRHDLAVLTRLPGIGKKTAERMVLELKDAVAAWGGGETPDAGGRAESDAAAALISLGYPAAVAAKAAHEAMEAAPSDADVESLLRAALALLGGGRR